MSQDEPSSGFHVLSTYWNDHVPTNHDETHPIEIGHAEFIDDGFLMNAYAYVAKNDDDNDWYANLEIEDDDGEDGTLLITNIPFRIKSSGFFRTREEAVTWARQTLKAWLDTNSNRAPGPN